jgi:hypothetical protein
MSGKTELFILYQMGNGGEWTWFSPIGIFLSEKALREHAESIGVSSGLPVLVPSDKNEVELREPQEYVLVRSHEGEVPEVELAE